MELHIDDAIEYLHNNTDIVVSRTYRDEYYIITNAQFVTLKVTREAIIEYVESLKNPKKPKSTIPKFWDKV